MIPLLGPEVPAKEPIAEVLPADLATVMAFLAVLGKRPADSKVRIVAGWAQPRGIHINLERGVHAVLQVPLRTQKRCDYEVDAHALIAHLVFLEHWPQRGRVKLLEGTPAGEVKPVVITDATVIGTLSAKACARLGATAHRAGRYEDCMTFWDADGALEVAMHCPIPGQPRHKVQLSEAVVCRFTPAVATTTFAVPYTVAWMLPYLGGGVEVSLTEENTAQFVGPRGAAVADLVFPGIR